MKIDGEGLHRVFAMFNDVWGEENVLWIGKQGNKTVRMLSQKFAFYLEMWSGVADARHTFDDQHHLKQVSEEYLFKFIQCLKPPNPRRNRVHIAFDCFLYIVTSFQGKGGLKGHA